MIESPLIRELMAERMHRAISRLLVDRFGTVPPEISSRLHAVTEEPKLDELNVWAARCPDLDAINSRLSSMENRQS